VLYLYFVPFIGFQIKYDDDDMSQPPNGISIVSAVFAQYISVTNKQTHSPRYV